MVPFVTSSQARTVDVMTRFIVYTASALLGTVYSVHPIIARCNLVLVYSTYKRFNEVCLRD